MKVYAFKPGDIVEHEDGSLYMVKKWVPAGGSNGGYWECSIIVEMDAEHREADYYTLFPDTQRVRMYAKAE